MAEMVRPSGHLQVVDRGRGPRWHALWRDADGRHQRSLGPAWVKNSGKRTPRGAIVWHTANGPKPDLSYLTPADAADELRRILAGAPRASATRGPRAGLALESVAWEWLEHGERKRGLKHPPVLLLLHHRSTVHVPPPPCFLCRALAPTEPVMGFGRGQGPAQAANPNHNEGRVRIRPPQRDPHFSPGTSAPFPLHMGDEVRVRPGCVWRPAVGPDAAW